MTLLLVTAAACSPAQRVAVGGGIAAAGMAVTYASIESMAGSCSQPRGPDGVCSSSADKPTSLRGGWPSVLAGVGVTVLGAAVMVEGLEQHPTPPTGTRSDPPVPPEKPVALRETEAVAMAVAHLVLHGVPPVRRKGGVGEGIDGSSAPAKLLGVDDAQSSLNVEGGRAELWNLRVLTAADAGWRTVGACYQYANEWRVTSLRATPGCPR